MGEDLLQAQELIKWADQVLFAYPNWWAFMPAIAKSFVDRVLMANFPFKNHLGKNFPKQLLKDKVREYWLPWIPRNCGTTRSVAPHNTGF